MAAFWRVCFVVSFGFRGEDSRVAYNPLVTSRLRFVVLALFCLLGSGRGGYYSFFPQVGFRQELISLHQVV